MGGGSRSYGLNQRFLRRFLRWIAVRGDSHQAMVSATMMGDKGIQVSPMISAVNHWAAMSSSAAKRIHNGKFMKSMPCTATMTKMPNSAAIGRRDQVIKSRIKGSCRNDRRTLDSLAAP